MYKCISLSFFIESRNYNYRVCALYFVQRGGGGERGGGCPHTVCIDNVRRDKGLLLCCYLGTYLIYCPR